ncbi:MAG: hypothetical protein RLZZ524_2337, partial [Pseudomonadota bacterium]
MLVWEDTPRSTPSSATPYPSNVPRDASMQPSSLPPVAAAPSTARAATDEGDSARRVNIADKRIINGQTDVNQLV